MAYIKFLNTNEIYKCKVSPSSNIVTLTFEDNIYMNTNGFDCYSDAAGKNNIGGAYYQNFKTIYRVIDDKTYQLSNDESVYEIPKQMVTFICTEGGELNGTLIQEVHNTSELVIPNAEAMPEHKFIAWEPAINPDEELTEPKVYTAKFKMIPSLEILKEKKIDEMKAIQAQLIETGIDVTFPSGNVEHFSLSENDQLSITALKAKVEEGLPLIPWHEANDAEHCKFYSNEDMRLICDSAINYVSYQVTYFRDLRIYINSLENEEEIENVVYGMNIPEQYQSEVLKYMISQTNAE